MTRFIGKITVWRAIFAAIMLSGIYATYLRVVYGLGGSTNLSDGGAISVQSTAGEGTEFRVALSAAGYLVDPPIETVASGKS